MSFSSILTAFICKRLFAEGKKLKEIKYNRKVIMQRKQDKRLSLCILSD